MKHRKKNLAQIKETFHIGVKEAYVKESLHKMIMNGRLIQYITINE